MNSLKTNVESSARNPAKRRQRGDTMIEVLVTVIIIAVGVLGAAALQITTLKNLSSSHSASVAAILVEDMSERMRANSTAALAGNYDHTEAPTTNTDCVTNPCAADSDLARYDIETWWDQIAAVLPLGTGAVVPLTAGSNTFVLTVRWDEDRSGSTGVECPNASADQRECYQFNVTL